MSESINIPQDVAIRFLVGGFSGVAAKTVLSPFDRIKLILQNQDTYVHIQNGTQKRYKGFLDAVVRLPKEQGILSYWRGNCANIVRYFPQQALNFSIYNYMSEHTILSRLPYMQNKLISGAISGGLTTILLYPLFFCQTKIAVDLGSDINGISQDYVGLKQCLYKTLKQEGTTGLYTGMYPTVIGYAVYKALYFAIFDYGKLTWLKNSTESTEIPEIPSIMVLIAAAQMAAIASSGLSYPLDTISRRLMLQTGKPAHLREYTGMINCAMAIYRKSGLKAFFAGNLTNTMRSVGSALVLVVNDSILYAIGIPN